ncbi:DUF418 domain-containing protein [Flindersiella endophytica]
MPERTTSADRPRIAALDVLRGFALGGILLANIQPIANRGVAIVTDSPVEYPWKGMFVDQRFFPIFSLLFGIGFSLLLDSASTRTPRPRLLLLRRLLVLLGLGALHHLVLWQGDILAIYAVVGLVVLLPSTWLPRWAAVGLTAVLLAVPFAVGGGYVALVPGLFLLGSTLTRYGVIERIERPTWIPAIVGLLLLAGAIPLGWLQGHTADQRVFGAAGLLTAGVYVCALLVLLQSPLRAVLRTIFEPLGRMALTNYLTATVLVLAITRFLDGRPETWPSATIFLIAGAVLTSQWVWSTLWLRRFRQGPLEWLWRWATWARRPAFRKRSGQEVIAWSAAGTTP